MSITVFLGVVKPIFYDVPHLFANLSLFSASRFTTQGKEPIEEKPESANLS